MGQSIYFGGPVITMEPALYAEAVLTRDGVIEAVGARRELEARGGEGVRKVDLRGRALVPSFLDPHSHITALARTLGAVNLTGAGSFAEIAERIRRFLEETRPEPGAWVTGFGYDHNFLREKRHPDRAALDAACPNHPLVITHASGHMGVMNSAGLRLSGVTAETPEPDGGVIGRAPGGREPSGYLEERAFTSAVAGIPQPSGDQLLAQLERAQRVYLSHGITTVQDGFTTAGNWDLLRTAADRGALFVDTVAYFDMEKDRAPDPARRGRYCGRLKAGGFKIFLDGSPQGRTAWMSEPYLGGEAGYRGYPIHTDGEVEAFAREALEEGMQILAHCNGDAAAEQWIAACEKALGPDGGRRIRPVMIHAQLVRPDQLARMARLSMIASFFTAHTWYWGDIHLKNFGPLRAVRISPARSAIEAGVTVTLHQDTPVIQPDMLETLWCAANRISRGGAALGGEERLTPLEALRAVTQNAAYQYFEEDRKGSLRAGKLANFAVLSGDPLKTEPERLKELRVLQTIREDEVLYDADEG